MKKKVLLYTDKNPNDPNVDLFCREFFYRDFEPVALITDQKFETGSRYVYGGGGDAVSIDVIPLENIPSTFLKIFPIVLIEIQNLQQTLDRFMKLETPIKNLIPWHTNGQSQPLVTRDEHGKIVCIDGLEFHCHDKKDEKNAQYTVGQYQLMKNYYKIPPSSYPDVISQLLYNSTRIKMDWNNPRTWQEKIQWLKLYDSNELKTICADKFKVREYVSRKIGSEYLIPLLGVWDNPDDINLDELPDQFVLKCNHGSGMNIIVRDRSNFDLNIAREKLRGWLMIDYGMFAFEFQYCRIPRKIIAEKFITISDDLPDIKFHCFNGEPKFVQYMTGRYQDLRQSFYNLDWKLLPFNMSDHPHHDQGVTFPKPKNYSKMVKLAKKLSEGSPYVRVDFYEVGNQIYFGELTFTPYGGIANFIPSEYDETFGDMIQLPKTEKMFNRFEKN